MKRTILSLEGLGDFMNNPGQVHGPFKQPCRYPPLKTETPEHVLQNTASRVSKPNESRGQSACRQSEILNIECLQGELAFNQLKGIWEALERLDEQCTPFNTWLWNSQWWKHYAARNDKLALLIASYKKRVVAIAPLYVHDTMMCRRVPVKVLRFVGTGKDTSPDYLNIIAHPQWRAAAERQLMSFLPNIAGWQKLWLSDVKEHSSLECCITKLIKEQPGTTIVRSVQTIQRATLPASFEQYRASLSRKRRKQINHRRNRLVQAGETQLNICANTAELSEATDALVQLHRLRWQSKRKPGAFRSVAYEQFHRSVIKHFFASDSLWLTTLKVDGQIVGVQYIFAWRGKLMFVQSGYSPDHEALSPGHVLFTYAIERGIEHGMHQLDMLKGHYHYKSAYTSETIKTVNQGYLKPGIRASISKLHRCMASLLASSKKYKSNPDG